MTEDRGTSLAAPKILNTDQGSQFIDPAYTAALHCDKVAICNDGRGFYRDDVFVERL